MIANIGKRVYRSVAYRTGRQINYWRLQQKFPLPRSVVREIFCVWKELPKEARYCPREKARVMASLIISQKLKITVEIGVFYGSSLFPQAIAHKYTGGIVIGVDPWSYSEGIQFQNVERWGPVENYLGNINWESVHDAVFNTIKRQNFGQFCKIMRMTSDQAANLVNDSIDMVHIDGNHDYVKFESDIRNWLPKLRVGGFLVMDDIGWSTIASQYQSLKQQMELVYEDVSWGCLIKV